MSMTDESTSLLVPHLRDYRGASNLAFNEIVNKRREAGEQIHHLAFGQSPFPVISEAKEVLCQNAGEAAYLQVAGLLKLRKAICHFHKKFDDLSHFSAEDVIVSPGSKELIFLLLSVFNGDVLLLSPSWTTYRSQACFARKNIHIISTNIDNKWKLTPELVEDFLKCNKDVHPNRLLILCNPDNPTGATYTAPELECLSSCFREHNIIVLSDEIYARLHFENHHQSLAKFYPEGTIVSSGISKWASAGGWRLGFHLYPKELAALCKTITNAASQTYSCAPAPVQHAAVWLYSNDTAAEEYRAHVRRILAAVGSYCYRMLVAVGVRVVKPNGGFYMFPDFEIVRDFLKSKGIDNCSQMCDYLLNNEGIALMSGGPAFLRPEKELTVRLCFIDFEGARALEESTKMGMNKELDEDFVAKHCTSMYMAINKLAKWVEDTKNIFIQ